MKVLVIGGSGFIGSHVVDALLKAGHDVRVFGRHPEHFRPALPNVDYRLGDFRDRMALAEALSGIEAVFHLVSTTFPGTANLDPKTDVRDNLISTLELIETMLSLHITRLLFVSSGGTVYGVPEQVPIPETHSLRPINSYGIVKVAIEQYLDMYPAHGRSLAGRNSRREPVWSAPESRGGAGRRFDVPRPRRNRQRD